MAGACSNFYHDSEAAKGCCRLQRAETGFHGLYFIILYDNIPLKILINLSPNSGGYTIFGNYCCIFYDFLLLIEIWFFFLRYSPMDISLSSFWRTRQIEIQFRRTAYISVTSQACFVQKFALDNGKSHLCALTSFHQVTVFAVDSYVIFCLLIIQPLYSRSPMVHPYPFIFNFFLNFSPVGNTRWSY